MILLPQRRHTELHAERLSAAALAQLGVLPPLEEGASPITEVDAATQAELTRADRAVALGRTEEALRALRAMLERQPRLVHARAIYAHALRRAGESEAATAVFRSLYELDPTNTNAILGVAWEHLDAGRWELAEAWAAKILGSRVLRAQALAVQAHARRGRGDREAAASLLLQAYEHGGRSTWLAEHCELVGAAYVPPGQEPPNFPVPLLQRLLLYATIERALAERAQERSEDGVEALSRGTSCDHTLGVTRAWALGAEVDRAALYQALAARGGFCDCEVLMNAAVADDERLGRPAVAAQLLACPSDFVEALEVAGIVTIDKELDEDESLAGEFDGEDPGTLTIPAQRADSTLVVALLRAVQPEVTEHGAVVVAPEKDDRARELVFAESDGALRFSTADACPAPLRAWLRTAMEALDAIDA